MSEDPYSGPASIHRRTQGARPVDRSASTWNGRRSIAWVATFGALASLAAIDGCSVKPVPMARTVTPVPIRETFAATQPQNDGKVRDQWVRNFGDPTLDAMVREALMKNLDLRIADGRLEEARARARKAGASLSPTLDFVAGASHGTPNAAFGSLYGSNPGASQVNNFDFGLQAGWELDVWGRVRESKRAAEYDVKVAQADIEFARQSLAAQVADSWILAIAAFRQINVAQDTLEIEKWTENIVRAKRDLGTASDMDLNIAHANLVTAESSLMQARSTYDDAVRSLEVLLARYPSAELSIIHEFPPMPPTPPAGVPSELLERRPDLIAADRAVAAAYYRTDAAKAARLPRISLTGTVGMASDQLRGVADPENLAWNLGANLVAPLLDGGQREEDIKINQAQKKQALAFYAKTAIAAFQEVETALNNETVLRSREEKVRGSVVEMQKAVESAKLRYDQGDMPLLQLNQVQNQYFAAEGDLVRLQGERLRQRIKLHLALGGSFLDVSTTQPADTQPTTQLTTQQAGKPTQP